MLLSYRAALKALGFGSVEGTVGRQGRRGAGRWMVEALEARQMFTTTVTSFGKTETGHQFSTTFAASDFTSQFSSDLGNLTTVRIDTLPAQESVDANGNSTSTPTGTLTLGGVAVTAGDDIPVADLGNLTYTPPGGFQGAVQFTWNGSADGSTFAASDANVTVAVLTNHAPTVKNVSIAATQNAVTPLTASEFSAGFSDPDASISGDSLQSITVTSLPTHGVLNLSGVGVVANQTISAGNIGNLTYTATAGYTGADSFGWNGSDGLVSAAAGATVALTVGNRLPTVSAIGEFVPVGAPFTFTTAEFGAGFSDADAGDTLQAIQITALPKNGTLTLSGAAVTKNQTISAANITNLVYTASAGFIGQDSFGWNGSDGKAFAKTGTTTTLVVVSGFDVLGNGAPIVNGDLKPTVSDFTDFSSMTTTPDPSIDKVTRTYTIRNSTSAAITIPANAVTISGTNGGDFAVVTQPTAGALAAGASETFVVSFAPTAAGKRTGTVTVGNSTGTAFVFAVQGTGIRTATIAAPQSSTDTAGLVQEGTTQNGSGAGAQNGQILGITYTGYLANGTVFDSTVIQGGDPLLLRLDNDYLASTPQPYLNLDPLGRFLAADRSLVAGFEYGLQGIKVGEKRTLVINATAGYAGSNSSLANSTIIFDVQCVSLVTKAQLQVDSVKSDGTPTFIIPAGQKTVSADDNTLFNLSNASSLSQSFKLVTLAADDATGTALSAFTFRTPGVKLSGAGAKDFAVSLSDNTLTLTYHPRHPGTKQATVKIYTTDPENRIFTFAVEGTSTAFVNLTTGFNKVKFPTGVLTSGSGVTLKVPVVIGNGGNVPTHGGSKSNIQVYAFNNTTQTYTLLTSENDVNVGGIGIGKTRKMNFTVALPVTLAAGSYSIFAEVNQPKFKDGTGTLTTTTEVNTDDDGSAASQTISVQQGLYGLSGTLTGSTVAAAGGVVSGNLSLNIQNTGTINLPAGQTVDVDVIAHPVGTSITDTSKDVVIESGFAVKLGLLGAGGMKGAVVPISYPSAGGTALAAGSYYLEARVSGANLANNGVVVVGTIAVDKNGGRATLAV